MTLRNLLAIVIALLACGCGALRRTTSVEAPMENAVTTPGNMRIHPRYEPLVSAPGTEIAEVNYYPKHLDWEFPIKDAAIVAIDCWSWHFSHDCLERIETSIQQNIVPLLETARRKGLLVIHAPADPVASRHPNWVKLKPKDARPQPEWPDSPEWPPVEFKQKKGPYAKFAKPDEPQHKERNEHRETERNFHPDCAPVGDEPVVLDGQELHLLLAERKILHLFFIGFNTNACVMARNYGLPAMTKMGYHGILVRDCTTGMETAATLQDMACTRGTISSIEQFYGYTVSAQQIIDALNASPKP